LLWLTVPDGLCLLRRDGAFLDVNAGGCELLGYTREELLARNVLDVQRHLDARVWDRLWQLVTPGDALSVETVVQHRNGARLPVEVRIATVRPDTELVMLALVRDISARREVDRLRQLQVTAGRAAHDLKNLLGVVVSCSEFAIEAAPDQTELRADLDEIMRAAERAAALATSLEADATQLDPMAYENPPAGLGETILVVEDEEAVRRLTVRILSESGYDTLTAASFDAATTVWEANRATIDLLLIDVDLGRRSGTDLADVLWQTAPELPVLFMSGEPSDAALSGGERRAGVVGKPLTSESLLRGVGAVLEGRR
jgi:PAS domain S-box-containing protein